MCEKEEAHHGSSHRKRRSCVALSRNRKRMDLAKAQKAMVIIFHCSCIQRCIYYRVFWVYWFVSRLPQDYIYALCVLLILILLPSVIFIGRWQGWYIDHVLKKVEAWLGPERKLLLWSFFWLCFTMGLMVVTPELIAVALILGLLKKI